MIEKWNKPDRWYVSPHNFAHEVVGKMGSVPLHVTVRDVTLCEGQHQPGIRYELEEMITIADALYEAGIRLIKQHAFDKDCIEFITAVKKAHSDVKISLAFPVLELAKYRTAPDRAKSDIVPYIDAGTDEIVFPGNISWSCPKFISDCYSVSERLCIYEDLIRFVRGKGIEVEVGQVDGTRATLEDLTTLYDTCHSNGMTSIGMYDSYGCSTPYAMTFLVSTLKKRYNLPIMVHAHNDFSSAVATTIGGILGGATICDLSINGLGDRAGNASLEETALQLEALYDIRTGIDLKKLVPLCKLVENITGYKTHESKPVTGCNIFSHNVEFHAKAIQEGGEGGEYIPWAEPYSPNLVGGTRIIVE